MSEIRVPLESSPMSVREARDATRRWLRDVGRPSSEHPVTLVVSELVTNSVRHARGPIVLHLWDQTDGVRVGVSDGSTNVALNEPARPDATGGRGLSLVERFSSSWGSDVNDTETGKLTWAEIPFGASP
jgi:anti-sigma regulatory factor (Ser/Thr protein kinase)